MSAPVEAVGTLQGLSRPEKLRLLESRAREATERSRAGRTFPLSFAQRRLWFLDRVAPGNPVSNIFRAFTFDGRLEVAALAGALSEIVRRHEALRTVFPTVGDEPRQRIEPAGRVPLPVIDLGGLPPAARRPQAVELARRESHHAFALERGPLLRATLLRLGEAAHVLCLTLHHIVADGWSLGLLLGELTALYPAAVAGASSPLAAPALQYLDFAVWQGQWMAGERLHAELAWWRERIGGAPAALDLPADRLRPAVESFRGALVRMTLPAAAVARLLALSREAGTTLFMTLLAAFEVLLYRHSGQAEFLVGTTVAGRQRLELEGVIGCFANTLLLPAALAGNPTFLQLLGRVRRSTLAAYGHQELPFDRLVEQLQPERHLSHNPLFQVMFALQNLPPQTVSLPELAIGMLDVARGFSKLDLTLDLAERGGVVDGYFEYSTDLFEEGTIAALAERFAALVTAIAADPGRGVADLPLLTAAERQLLLFGWNPHGYELRPPVPALVAAQARRTPAAPALLFGDEVLTYAQLDERANRLARHLRRRGAGPDTLVGLCLERSPAMAVALLAVLKAGAGYVPLDPAYPRERLALMIRDTGMQLALTAAPAAASLRAAIAGETGGSGGPAVIDLDLERARIEGEMGSDPGWEIAGEGLAYVVYTSGSTGRPKGVGVPHRALSNHATECARCYELDPGDRVLQFTSISFDITSEEVFPTWIAGAAVVPRMPGLFPAFAELEALLERHRVTVVNLPTAYWHEWASELHRLRRQPPAALRLVVIGTEQALPERLAEWLELTGGRVRFANSYASTECTVTALIHLSGPESLARARRSHRIPVGRPIANCRVYVLDARLEPVPVGVPGDVYIGGANVSRGYLNLPERTAASFLPDPFAACGPGGRIYRQGDRGRFLPSGELECLGRSDDQVKVRGYRVEPGEIEAVLARHPAVRECAALVREDGPGGRRLVAYVAEDPDRRATAEELRAWLKERLPAYMVPAGFVILGHLPLTSNGKLDRRALRRLEPAGESTAAAAADAHGEGSPLAGVVAEIWEQVLHLPRVGLHDDFFELGGHSLLATQVISRLREALGVELPLRTLFAEPTVAGVAAAVDTARRAVRGLTAPAVTRAPHGGAVPCSFAQQRLWVVDQLTPGSSAYNLADALRWQGPLALPCLRRAADEVVRRHEVLRTTFAVAGGQAVQVIAPPAPLPLPVVDLGGGANAEARLGDRLHEASRRPFDLAHGPLLRAVLYRLGAEDHVLLLCLHHIISDGLSNRVLVHELLDLYLAFSRGEPSPLPELPVQYADFARWQRAFLAGGVLAAQLAYWRGQLAGAPPAIDLPTDRPRPPMATAAGARHAFTLPAGLARGLGALGRRRGATLFMTLLAAFDALLARWSGQDEVVVGWPTAGRGRTELEGLIGYLANILVHHARVGDGTTLSGLLGEVREKVLDAFTHGDLPFELLVEELRPERHLSHNPIFQVLCVLHRQTGGRPLGIAGAAVRPVPLTQPTSLVDLSLAVTEREAGLEAFFEYKTALFDPSTVRRMAGHLLHLLAAAVAAPEAPLAALPILSPAELHQLVHGLNDTADAAAAPALAHQLFAARAAAAPAAIALEHGDEVLSYGELAARASRLARRLCRMGVGRGELVGICLERGPAMVVSLLAVLASGGAYVPLDPTYPSERLAFIVSDAGMRLLLCEGGLAGSLPALDAAVLDLDGKDEEDEEDEEREPEREPERPALGPLDVAYVIYTSGSTGKPKGVAVSHGGLANFLLSMARQPGLTAADSLLAVTTIAFDIAALEIFLPLTVGARIILAGRAEAADGKRLAALLQGCGATAMQATPATWRLLLAAGWRGEPRLKALCGGEALAGDLARQLLGCTGELWNLYGPTETTIWSAAARVRSAATGTVAIGGPIANTGLHLLDRRLERVPLGVAGELHIGGAGLAQGYLRRPDLTAERFVPDPCGGTGARLYRSGDLARRLPAGEIEFLGRLDHQVKVRGYRVELGEIEAVLGQHPAVAQAVVVVREREPGNAQLVAYVVAAVQAASAGNLRAALREELPEYMVPSLFVILPELPLTPNGKVDRKALPPPDADSPRGGRKRIPPRTPVEQEVAAVWSAVLGLDVGGVHDNFFELGGHSLMATQVISRLEESFRLDLGLAAIFKTPTVAGLSETIMERELERADGQVLAALLAQLGG